MAHISSITSITALFTLTLLFLIACIDDQTPSQPPTARIELATRTTLPAAEQPRATFTLLPPPETQRDPTIAPVERTLTPSEQYRAWMEEAHTLYPYAESVDTMWALMMCESSGNPDSVADVYYGLFQYTPSTWAGDWNPYRDQPILDPHAQILATAKAWYDGHQEWWGCYR